VSVDDDGTMSFTGTSASPSTFTVTQGSPVCTRTGPSSPLTAGIQGAAYGPVTITTSGCGSPAFAISGQPAGIVIDSSTGAITGTPTQNGTFSSVLTSITDANGNSSETDSLTIANSAITVASTSRALTFVCTAATSLIRPPVGISGR
jgi:Putative Ig domain